VAFFAASERRVADHRTKVIEGLLELFCGGSRWDSPARALGVNFEKCASGAGPIGSLPSSAAVADMQVGTGASGAHSKAFSAALSDDGNTAIAEPERVTACERLHNLFTQNHLSGGRLAGCGTPTKTTANPVTMLCNNFIVILQCAKLQRGSHPAAP
jgi:hypothetical protein